MSMFGHVYAGCLLLPTMVNGYYLQLLSMAIPIDFKYEKQQQMNLL